MIINTGSRDFTQPALWRLHLPAGAGKAPLLVALHGKGDRIERFEAEALEALPPGWALLVPAGPIPRDGGARPRPDVAGPAPISSSWYLYDGDTDVFRESVARAASYLRGVVEDVIAASPTPGYAIPDASRVALLGFSQGAYLAGLAAVQDAGFYRAVVLVGGRLKVESLTAALPGAAGLAVLGLHGALDEAVRPGPSRECIEAARQAGLAADWSEHPCAHEFSPSMRKEASRWLGKVVA
jgi:predicted esterase